MELIGQLDKLIFIFNTGMALTTYFIYIV